MNRIRELREEKGMSLSALAKELNMTASAIGNYEREEREPKLKVWEEIARYFNVPVEYLMGISDQNKMREMKDLLLKGLKDREFGVQTNSIINTLALYSKWIDTSNDENITKAIDYVIILVAEMCVKENYNDISELCKIIGKVCDIYYRSQSRITTLSKEDDTQLYLDNLNEITNILNKWYINNIDKTKYNQKN